MAMALFSRRLLLHHHHHHHHHQQQQRRHCISPSLRRIAQRSDGTTLLHGAKSKLSRPASSLKFGERANTMSQPCCESPLRLPSRLNCLRTSDGPHGETGEWVSSLKEERTVDADTDAETVEWVNSAVRDPMVEVDPVTVTQQIQAEKQSLLVQKESLLAQTASPPLSQNSKGPSNIAIASVTALILLVLAAVVQFLRFRRTNVTQQLDKGATSSFIPLEPTNQPDTRMKVIEETIKATGDPMVAKAEAAAEERRQFEQGLLNSNSMIDQTIINGRTGRRHSNIIERPKFEQESTERPDCKSLSDTILSNSRADQVDTDIMERPDFEQGFIEMPDSKSLTDHTLSDSRKDQVDTLTDQVDSRILERPLFEQGLIESLESSDQVDTLPDEVDTLILEAPQFEQGLIERLESKSLPDQTLYHSRIDEVDTKVVSEENRKQTYVTEVPGLSVGKAFPPSSLTLHSSSYSVESPFIKAGQSQNGGTHTSDSMQKPFPFVPGRQQDTAWKTPVKLATKDSLAWLSSSSDLHSPAKDSTEPSGVHVPSAHSLDDPALPIVPVEESSTDILGKVTQKDRESFNKALQAVMPAVAIGVGAVGALAGVAGGLQVVGFAAATSLITRELLWAQTRDELWQEVRNITDRQKLLDFLKKRKIVEES